MTSTVCNQPVSLTPSFSERLHSLAISARISERRKVVQEIIDCRLKALAETAMLSYSVNYWDREGRNSLTNYNWDWRDEITPSNEIIAWEDYKISAFIETIRVHQHLPNWPSFPLTEMNRLLAWGYWVDMPREVWITLTKAKEAYEDLWLKFPEDIDLKDPSKNILSCYISGEYGINNGFPRLRKAKLDVFIED